MTTWDDKPNDYEHALQIIEQLETENERLRAVLRIIAETMRLLHSDGQNS